MLSPTSPSEVAVASLRLYLDLQDCRFEEQVSLGLGTQVKRLYPLN